MDDGMISEVVGGGKRGWGEGGEGGSVRDGEASSRLQLTANTVQVVHGSVKGEPHSFSDAGGRSLL